jgi:molybdopterin synthase catalytic subunit
MGTIIVMTHFKIRLFASLKDLAGAAEVEVQAPAPLSVEALRQALAEQVPALAPALPSALLAVNQEYAFAGESIQAGDELAFFPPVSGGQEAPQPEYFALIQGAVDLNALTERILSPATGAAVVFSGFVRGQTQAQGGELEATTALEYEAYEPMALAKMRQVAAEIRQRWPGVQGIAIAQSLGTLQVGQATVLIACTAAHRDGGCFEAARYGIDRLKEIVPVWKKEHRPDSAAWIEGPYQPQTSDRQDA